MIVTESVDSVCRDGTDMPYVAIQTEAWKTATGHVWLAVSILGLGSRLLGHSDKGIQEFL